MRVQFSRRLPTLSVLGVGLGVVALHQSMAPTLLVRTWYFQGVVTGVAIACGYAVGALVQRAGGVLWRLEVAWFERRTGRRARRPSRATLLRVQTGFLVAVVALAVLAVVDTVRMQRWTWDRLGRDVEHGGRMLVGTTVVVVAVLALLVGVHLLLRWVRRNVTWVADLVLPRWAAVLVALVLVVGAVSYAANTWLYQRALGALNQAFTLADADIEDGVERPTSTVRTGGPASEVAWEDLGVEGRRFLDRGPSVDEIAALDPNGEQAVEPVRVFVGRKNADDVEQRVALAMDELERFGAFERELVLVAVPTGTGWINEQIVQPLEYTFGGDVATVAMQYSHLPSPLAFLTEAQAAQETGEALIGAVQERLAEIPEAERPAFAVAGESLGTFGASEAFDDLDDLLGSTDASLWTGPPASVHLRRQAEDERTDGSLQIKPVWRGSDRVVFANRPSDLRGSADAVFLQQADDAIVWWEVPVLWAEPEWLNEPLDPAVNPHMRWYPVTTMLNLAVDMAVATAFEEEQGHKYGTQPTLAWRLMLPREGWDDAAYERLLDAMEAIDRAI